MESGTPSKTVCVRQQNNSKDQSRRVVQQFSQRAFALLTNKGADVRAERGMSCYLTQEGMMHMNIYIHRSTHQHSA